MLFNSHAYLLAFLPLALLIFHGLRRLGLARPAVAALVLLSLGFYAWWNPVYLVLLVGLLLANFFLGMGVAPRADGRGSILRKALLVLGLAMNLSALVWFKYANFAVDQANSLLGLRIELARIVLPLGISFFIFQKIAYLVDSHRGLTRGYNFFDYCLFVSFFPQLIAGPIVHHREVVPQFARPAVVGAGTVAMGVTILAIGLAKKVLLADNVAPYASARFDAAAMGQALTALDAWVGALAYTAQLYFDFSGYSDMAIGSALLFGIALPVNFASPYKAGSVIDFWRRWHITLSRFLREYLYFPLGGNRKGRPRRYVNLIVTMLLGGIWHGAGWAFAVWGLLHGAYLVANHAWRAAAGRLGIDLAKHRLGRLAAWAATFLAVVVAWVFFRAANVQTAWRMLTTMFGARPGAGPGTFVDTRQALLVAGAMLTLAWLGPNTQELTGYKGPGEAPEPMVGAVSSRLRWRPTLPWAAAAGAAIALAFLSLSRVSEFIYFQF